jgi:hypothetical protein
MWRSEMNEHFDPEAIGERSRQIVRLLNLRRDKRIAEVGSAHVPIIEDWLKVLFAQQLSQSPYEAVETQVHEWLDQGKDPFVVLLAQKLQLQLAVEQSLELGAEQLVNKLDLFNVEGQVFTTLTAVQNELNRFSKIALVSLMK